MRVAVVGAGVYGCTIAVELARAGYSVDLYDRHWDLLYGATRANQARLHLGYHYPRSLSTALAAQRNASQFINRFPNAINRRNTQCYAIASEGSSTSAGKYLKFCEDLTREYQVRDYSLLKNVDVCVRVPEAIVNIVALREQLRRELRQAGVQFHRDMSRGLEQLHHDAVVMATYGLGWPEPLRWEVCEVPIIRGAYAYGFKSFVILDGPFGSIDPLPTKAGHLLYHVQHTVHAANVGFAPEIPKDLAPFVDAGPVSGPTNLPHILKGVKHFFKDLDEVTHIGSMFSVRAVLPNVDETDERPTLYHQNGRVLYVLAGKIDGAPAAAERVKGIVANVGQRDYANVESA